MKNEVSDNQELIEDFADLVSSNILEYNEEGHDSFEIYAHHLREHIHQDKDKFKHRFSDGYKALLEELIHLSEDNK